MKLGSPTFLEKWHKKGAFETWFMEDGAPAYRLFQLTMASKAQCQRSNTAAVGPETAHILSQSQLKQW